ncbi:MAG: nuclear transport factor 2 family protein [Anaerolineae bacterium]|nr:nuclear transport factor 2 family protein [Anaerolineae bacterium]
MEEPRVFNLDHPPIESLVQQHLAAWQARDVAAIAGTLHPEVEFIWPALHGQSRREARAVLETRLAEVQSLYLHLRRLLIDPAQRVAAVEWIGRYARSGEKDCQEILGGAMLDFDQEGLIYRWRTYLDPVRRRTLSGFDDPLPSEGWSPCPNPGPPPSPAQVQQIIQSYAQAWTRHDLAQLNATIHDEMIVQPPWDYVVGRAAIEAGARVYFANYTDTCVTPQRLILDPSQPHFGVCEQTFACTNPDTGRRGKDHDFAFFEIAQGKLRYWRTYFDTSRSAQVVEKTVGFLQSNRSHPK